MTDLLLHIAVSNACISLVLALAALVVETTAKRPAIAHLLWVLVFVKMVTPPMVSIPVITLPVQPDHAVMSELPDYAAPIGGVAMNIDTGDLGAYPIEASRPSLWELVRPLILIIWLLGSGFILVWSLVRVYRFDRLLRTGSEAGPSDVQAKAARIAGELGLRSVPTIYTTSAKLSPLVWWVGGKVRIVIPRSLLADMNTEQSQWVLAHELAHVRRRDHAVRWLEWLACVGFWWNPLVWWGRRHLRTNEEICCDDLVLSSLKPKPRAYADSLLHAIEHLAFPMIRPPAVASEINSGGFLQSRFKMIVSGTRNRQTSRWLQAAILLVAAFTIPVGLTYAQNFDAVEKRLAEAVDEGDVTMDQATIMMEVLRQDAVVKHDNSAEQRFEKWVGGISETIKAAVERADLSEKEAWEKWHHFKTHELWPKLRRALAEGLVSEEWASELREGISKSELGNRLKAAVAKGEMTEEEAWAKWAEISTEYDATGRLNPTIERFCRETAARSTEENRREKAQAWSRGDSQ